MSLASTSIVTGVSSSVAAVSSLAVGASLTPVTVTVTVAESLAPYLSSTVYSNFSTAVSPSPRYSNFPFGL